VIVLKRKLFISLAMLSFLLSFSAAPAVAQNLIMNSAETINEHNFKLSAFPTIIFGEGGAANEWGGFARVGYGFTPSFDVEAKFAFFDGLKLYGADAEFWITKHKPDVSISVGVHRKDRDGSRDSTSLDGALLVSGHIENKLELYAGLNVGRESVSDTNRDFTTLYVVPGIEYKISDELDFVSEFGVGLTDESPNYFSFGVALYLR
jgi:hypothetical protein